MKTIIISLNSVIDKHFYFQKFTLNEENFSNETEIYAAGKGVNIAKALSVFDSPFELVMLLGEDNFYLFNELLSRYSISSHCVLTKGKIRENISIHSPQISETRICSNDFFTTDEKCIQVLKKAYEFTSDGDIVIFSGSLPKGISKNIIVEKLSEFHKKNIKLILDSSSLDINDYKTLRPFLIKPNENEIKMFGEEEKEGINNLIKVGVENIAVSKGAKGIYLYNRKEEIRIIPPTITAVSTVGAGDSTVSGFAYGLMNKMDIKEAGSIAVAFGTACCLTKGGEPPCKNKVKELVTLNNILFH